MNLGKETAESLFCIARLPLDNPLHRHWSGQWEVKPRTMYNRMYDLCSHSEPQAYKVPTLGLILRCHHLGVLNDCEQEDTFSLCTRPCKFCNQFYTYCQSPVASSLLLPPVTDELLWLLNVTGGTPSHWASTEAKTRQLLCGLGNTFLVHHP